MAAVTLPILTDAQFWELAYGAERLERAQLQMVEMARAQEARLRAFGVPEVGTYRLDFDQRQLAVVEEPA